MMVWLSDQGAKEQSPERILQAARAAQEQKKEEIKQQRKNTGPLNEVEKRRVELLIDNLAIIELRILEGRQMMESFARQKVQGYAAAQHEFPGIDFRGAVAHKMKNAEEDPL